MKFLLVPVIMIGTNINSNNCYSIESTNEITNNVSQNNELIKYSENGPSNDGATFKQWTTRASFDPINTNDKQYDNFNVFCEEHNLLPLKEGIRGFLVDIYNLAHLLINGTKNYWGTVNISTEKWKSQYLINNLILLHLEKQNAYYQCIHINNIKSTIRIAQKKLNKNKYSGNNNLNDINFNINESLKLMECCYYFANQLVQLTHDIVYAINNKVNNYKNEKISDKDIYKEFKKYLINEVINPCYRALDQAFLLFINSEDDFILNNIELSSDSDMITLNFLYHIKHNCNMKDIKYHLIYNFSMFKTELSGKNQKFIKTLHNRVNTIAQNIRNTSTHYITRTLYMLQTLFVPRYFIYDYNYYVYQDIIDGYDNTSIIEDIIDNIGKTTNKDIIDIANEYLNNVYYSVDMRLKYVNEHDYKQKCFYNIQENEQNERKQYEEAFKSLYKTLNAIDMKIPNNKDYLSEIKELLKYIG